jgi:hypothetical protein
MSLQINVPITTSAGFDVAAGAYVWIQEERSLNNKYSVRAILKYYKNKAAFDAGKAPFEPNGALTPLQVFYQEFTAASYGAVTSLSVQTYVRDQLIAVLGAGSVTLVQ